MRLDSWLHAVRLYKTRSLATEAVKGGHVKINGASPKPAYVVKIGDLIHARTGHLVLTYEVLGFPKSRVSASLVPQYAANRTPEEVYERERERIALLKANPLPFRSGRPTGKQRRILDDFRERNTE